MKRLILSFVLVMVSILVMSVGVMAATCPSGTTPIDVETVNVDSSQSTAVSTSALENGVTYLLEASGTADAGDTIDFDAQYSKTNRILNDPWTDSVSGYVSDGPGLLDLLVDGMEGLWGTYNPTHTYSLEMLGTGAPAELLIYDIYYPNNIGSLRVDVSKCVVSRTAEITSPGENEIVHGLVNFEAFLVDDDEDHISWAVRKGTCAAGTNTVFGNVDGHSDSLGMVYDANTYTYSYSTTTDVSGWDPGMYCFIFNPREDSGESGIRLTREFVVVSEVVHGGGHILEEVGEKRKDWLDISFGGFIGNAGTAGLVGNWQINFHNVNVDDIDKSHFHATEIVYLNLYSPSSTTCTGAMNFKATGEWNGIPDYRIIFRAGDSSEPSSESTDTVRVQLFNPLGDEVYDTHDGDFADESSCVGTARTGLDTGNIIIQG